MVKSLGRLIQPANECDVCHNTFHQGDRCVVVVRVPDGGYDTLCLNEWAGLLAAAKVALEEVEAEDGDAMKSRLDEQQAIFTVLLH